MDLVFPGASNISLFVGAALVLLSRDPAVGWFDMAQWPHAFRLARLFGWIN